MKELIVTLMEIFNEQIIENIVYGSSLVNIDKVFETTAQVISNDSKIKERQKMRDLYNKFTNCYKSYDANRKSYLELTETIYSFQITCNECFGYYLGKI